MIPGSARGIFLLSLLSFACGETSRNAPTDGPESSGGAGLAGGKGGAAGSNSTAGKATSQGGSAAAGMGGKGSTEGGTAGSDSGRAGQSATGDADIDLTGSPIYTRAQRLTHRQWENAVTDVLRLKRRYGFSDAFTPPVTDVTSFDNNERVLVVESPQFLEFESGAEAAAAAATGSADALASLYSGDDAADFVRVLGRRAFRRPLTESEKTKYQNVFALGEHLYGAGFANGASLVIRAMLESPHFLYRTELGPAGEPLSSYELASKLSFWLLETTPSDALLDAAGAGELDSVEQLVATANEMLDDPRAVGVMRDFHGQVFQVEQLRSIDKMGVVEYDPAVESELALASKAFFDLVFQQNLGLRGLLTSTEAYVGPGLAPFYELQAPQAGLELREVGPSRTGYFMQVPFLLLGGQRAQSDPIRRGVNIVRSALCGGLGVPALLFPPLPPQEPGETNRERVTRFTAGCGLKCHSMIDPLGFAFENFDGLGRQRELDNGLPVDTSASYAVDKVVEPFSDGTELMRILADSAQAHVCYSKHVTGYALGRDVVEEDRPVLQQLGQVSRSRSLKALIGALVQSSAFRVRKAGLP